MGGLGALLDKCPKDRFSLSRFLAEQLVVRDVYGSLNRPGSSPLLLTQEHIPRFMEAGGWSRNDDEWESFDRMFGETPPPSTRALDRTVALKLSPGFSRDMILLAWRVSVIHWSR